MPVLIAILSFSVLYTFVSISRYDSIESILLILCSTIIGCTFWIVETIKSSKSNYKPINLFESVFGFFRDEYNDFKKQ